MLVFSKTAFQAAQIPDTYRNDKDQVTEYLNKLDILKSMRPDGINPWVPRDLANVITRPLSINFTQSGNLSYGYRWPICHYQSGWLHQINTPLLQLIIVFDLSGHNFMCFCISKLLCSFALFLKFIPSNLWSFIGEIK